MFGIVLFTIFACLVLGLWNPYELGQFTRYDGRIKRGIKVWSEPISSETIHFLETLPISIQHGWSFIRKERNEILIATEERPILGLFRRRKMWPYIAYINLNEQSQKRIEFRMSWSTLSVLILAAWISSGFFLWIFFIVPHEEGFSFLIFPCMFPILFPLTFIREILSNHHRERERLLTILSQAMGQEI